MNTKFLAVALVAMASASMAACSGSTDTDAGGDVASDSSRGCDDTTLHCDASAVDAGVDVATDMGVDAATDAGTDVPVADTGVDAPVADTGVDVAVDTGHDASSTDGGLAALCTSTGGTITTGLCCGSTGDFPNMCTTGSCGCSPSSSHNVMKCQCATGQCFDPALGCH